MSISYKRRGFSAGLLMLAAAGMASPVRSEVTDYEFQLLASEVKQSENALLAVRLINKPTGHAVPGAVIFTHRLDMAPDGMATMKSRLVPLPSTEPGIYPFKADLSMERNWRLSLAAKVQGEVGTVQARLIFKAVE
jgi:hypothetical protein